MFSVPQWVDWGQVGQNWFITGQNWVKCGSNMGRVGHPGHLEGSMGHVGPEGHVHHCASKFMVNGYWGYWISLYGSNGLPAHIIGHYVCRPHGIPHHWIQGAYSTFYSKFKQGYALNFTSCSFSSRSISY